MEDLTDAVTVFVPTCGYRPSLERCVRALHEQDVMCKTMIIRDVAPMSAAFNEMLARCETPYFVQCDDDMILRSFAVSRMVSAMQDNVQRTAIHAHALWDPHVARPIIGVKICAAEALRAVGGWRDVQSCEVDQLARLRAADWAIRVTWDDSWGSGGNFVREHPLVVGDHDPMYTPELAYERYRDLMLKQRRFGQALWVEALPGQFLARVNGDAPCIADYAVELAAFAGCIAGFVAPLDAENREKDFARRPWTAEWTKIAEVLGI